MEININAPAVVNAELFIDAPLSVVWSVLTNIDEWSHWNPVVSSAEMRGNHIERRAYPRVGTGFHWKARGVPITSTLKEVVPMHRVAWTGSSLSVQAIHLWTFEEIDHGVLVRTEESCEGALVSIFASPLRIMLANTLQTWLHTLKAECERKSP